MAVNNSTAAQAGSALAIARRESERWARSHEFARRMADPQTSHNPSHGRLFARMAVPRPRIKPDPVAEVARRQWTSRPTAPMTREPPIAAGAPPQYEFSQ